MRLRTLCLVAVCGLVPGCTSTTDPEMQEDPMLLDYSLSSVDGEVLPGPISSLPGLRIWEGHDGSILTVARGELGCAPNGRARETYLFRLSHRGSAIWEPISVELDLTCERTDPAGLRFHQPTTGETVDGLMMERFDGCPLIQKGLPSLEGLRAGYKASDSDVEFPAELEFDGPMIGQFLAAECLMG